ncbi:uncharacterized protein LOC114188559 [Vigna unguiculata]|uniref:uncharacterized protein LOC114188559 n=1 Tax=Vigna unguiculata TaxID=3917 RepID=UPI0010167444|nr:uncharacterized protein LOC114188559 [Vigna unguiculata]
MEGNMSHVAIPLFDGESYDLWAVRMQTYLEGLDLWEVVEEDDVPLSENPTMAQMKAHKEKKTRKAKAKSCLFAGVSQMIMTRIMTLKSPKEIWEYLKAEYEGNEKIRVLERYEASIASLENTKDLSTITFTEVIHALQAQEQRRLMREDHEAVEGNLNYTEDNALIVKKNRRSKYNNTQVFPSCPHCKRKGHQPNWCWWRPDVKCHKCGQLGHVEKVCKSKDSEEDVQIVENKSDEDKSEEDLLFTTSCVTTNQSSKDWIIDSGCTNHMTHDREIFKELNKSNISKRKVIRSPLKIKYV